MKPIYLLAAFLFCFSLPAQAPLPVPLAHGDVPGEPHHHLKIENSYVRAYYVEVPPHEATQLHQHDHDYTFVSIGPADVTNAVLEKPEVHLQMKDAEMHFTRGGFAHVARNNSDAPFRNVTIAFLRPQENPRNRCAALLPGPVGDCPASEASSVPQFETDELLIESVSVSRSSKWVDQQPKTGALLVSLEGSQLQVNAAGKVTAQLDSGGVFWLPAKEKRSVSARGGAAARFLLISFKDSAAVN
jgi:hypothetical protein